MQSVPNTNTPLRSMAHRESHSSCKGKGRGGLGLGHMQSSGLQRSQQGRRPGAATKASYSSLPRPFLKAQSKELERRAAAGGKDGPPGLAHRGEAPQFSHGFSVQPAVAVFHDEGAQVAERGDHAQRGPHAKEVVAVHDAQLCAAGSRLPLYGGAASVQDWGSALLGKVLAPRGAPAASKTANQRS